MKEKNHEETVFWEWYFHSFHMYIQYTDSVYQSRMCVCVCVSSIFVPLPLPRFAVKEPPQPAIFFMGI